MDKPLSLPTFIWRTAASHTIAYFAAGLFAVVFMRYGEHYASQALSQFMRPVDSPWDAIGPALQLIRGGIIALILYPFRQEFLEMKSGGFKLALLTFGLSYVSTIGPTPGSFEGYIYTKLPIRYHLLGIPEALLYTAIFSFLIVWWNRHPKKMHTVVAAILVGLVLLMSVLGLLKSLGILKVQ